jgi:ParB family transcriptional regulator, chromosome partitioning protein
MELQTTQAVVELPLDLMDESPSNPRERYDERSLKELAGTINSVGLVQPVIVRPHPEASGRFELVFGSRRRRASVIAGKNTVPAIIRELNDEQVLVIQFIENEHRENLSPLSQARGYAALMKAKPGLYTVEELSARLGKSDNRYVAERLQLLKLIEPAQKLLGAERLPFRHAFELSRLQPEQQEKALYVCFTGFESAEAVLARPHQTVSVSLEGLRQWVSTHCHLDLNHAPFPLDQPLAGVVACKECPKRAGSAPLLFGDICQEENTCLDPDCFARKKSAIVQLQVERLEQQGVQPVRISNNLRVGVAGEKADVLYRGEYRYVERDACSFTEVAVYDDGSQPGKTVYVCREESCPVHAGRTRYASPEEQAVRKKRVRDQREERQYRTNLLSAVKDKLGKTPQRADLYLVACRLLQLMPHEQRVAVFRLLKWPEQKSAGKRGCRHVDYLELGRAHLGKFGVFELHRFLIVASLTPDLSIPDSDPDQSLPSTSLLAQTAKRLGIVPKDVRASTRKSFKVANATA